METGTARWSLGSAEDRDGARRAASEEVARSEKYFLNSEPPSFAVFLASSVVLE